MPTTGSPAENPEPGGADTTSPSPSWPSTSRRSPSGGVAVDALGDLAVGAADSDQPPADEQRAVKIAWIWHLVDSRRPGSPGSTVIARMGRTVAPDG